MQINDIKILVARLGAIVDGWDEQSGAPAVERHIAASLLAELYEAVKFDTALAATEVSKVVEVPAPVAEPVEEPQTEEQVAEVIDLSDIFGGSFDDEPEEVEEPAEEVAPEEEPEEVADQPEVEEDAEVEEEPEVEVMPEPEIEEEPEPAESEVEPAVEEEVVPEVEEEVAPEVEEETPAVEEVAPAIEEEVAAPAVEEKVEEEKAPEVEEEKPESKQASLFDMEVVRRPRSSSGRRVIMSLYGESAPAPQPEKPAKTEKVEKVEKVEVPAEPTPAPAPTEEPAPAPIEPQKEEQPIENATVAVSVAERLAAAQSESQPQILGEVIGAGTTTVAEAVAASQPTVQTVQNDRVNSLRNAIGINDRFILIRDLFGGDGAAYDRVIEQLDSFDDFNECLVCMSEYRWNPNSDGARLLMDLITRKLL
ncbi:MAG: hypothetical protein IKT94_02025 [Rikenellaceae bacterium]|nr:hypothetical protein [Rikenellaceae bacterium]